MNPLGAVKTLEMVCHINASGLTGTIACHPLNVFLGEIGVVNIEWMGAMTN